MSVLDLDRESTSNLCHTCQQERHARNRHGDGAKHLSMDEMTRVEVKEGAAHGRSDECADTRDTEAHSEAGADLCRVVRDGEDSAWW